MSNTDLLNALRQVVGEQRVRVDATTIEDWGGDWTKQYPRRPLAVAFPGNSGEVSEIVKLCAERRHPVVPSGGRTGLAGGAVATNGEVVLSLDRLNRILRVDAVGSTITVEAGVKLQAVQETAREAGFFFPLDLAARGSSQIGGNIATNAGGTKFIRYGGAREQVLGLEVVLPSGEILHMNQGVRKNNTGYDLRQLFIGSEGTLGIITAATLRMWSKPQSLVVACLAVQEFTAIPNILRYCNQHGVPLTAFEFFTRAAHEIVLGHASNLSSPFAERSPFYVILELEASREAGQQPMEQLLEGLFNDSLISDAVVAGNSRQFEELWALRERITESLAASYRVHKNDISVAIDQLDTFVAEVDRIVGEHKNRSDVQLILFGHIGDGNLHLNYIGPRSLDAKVFQSQAKEIETRVFELIHQLQGSISAEHGIGLLKKGELHISRTPAEIAIMRGIKGVLDPLGIMNPGKIF